jgi:hypothetical protein
VVDLTSDEEDAFPDTSLDEDFARRLFSDLNHGLLGPPGDGKVIILNDSEEKEEAREENTTNADATPRSAMRSLTATASTTDADEALKGVQNDNSDGRTPNREIGDGRSDEAEASLLYVPDEQGFHRVSGQLCRGVH